MLRVVLVVLIALAAGCGPTTPSSFSSDDAMPSTAAAARTFLVPKALRLDHGQVVFHRSDAERVTLDVGAGVYLGARVRAWSNDELLWESLGGVIEPDSSNSIEDRTLSGYQPPAGATVYVVEVFETKKPPVHLWMPEGQTYRTLWMKSFTVERGR